MKRRWLACLSFAFLMNAAQAGDFGVSPIRIDLDSATKSALITITNDDERPLAFQVRAMQWTQDADGADRYSDTADLVYFPQQLKIAPKESRAVRVGYKVPALQSEKAYRLFIEELADAAREPSRTGVAITLRFGVPVFLRPAADGLAGQVQVSAAGGNAVVRVHNTGNVHFRIASVRLLGQGAQGETVFEQSLDGWYLLSGAERAYRFALPAATCARVRVLRVEAPTEKLPLHAERVLDPGNCR
jgi:fimbrial chaperone protein